MSHEGEVVMWSEGKGIGFIKSKDYKSDIFVHHTGFGGGSLKEGGKVKFDVEDDRGRDRAVNVTGEAVDPDTKRRKRSRSSDSRSRSRERGRGRDRDRRMFVVKFKAVDRDLDEDDIFDFFDDHNVDIHDKKTIIDHSAGMAFAVLYSQDDFDYAVNRLDGKKIGRGKGRARSKIYRSGDRDYNAAKRRKASSRKRGRRRSTSYTRSSSSRSRDFSRRSRTPPKKKARSVSSRSPSPTPPRSPLSDSGKKPDTASNGKERSYSSRD
eukprot:TRINITY_DN4865_c4_g1_i1.p1 TRINITY_DN4865_c4_g1~~TRINITY_DN4865_c4_g1_i1.p1  ORF type:complete len:297 (+),score=64.48 TRINITY_DN4865_c4_g1_i1:95-892(+)